MSDRMKTLWIGIFIIAAIVAIASLLLFLEPTVGDEGKTLRVRFSNIEKISIGTRVTFAGKPVGEVVQINEIFDARSQPSDSLGNIYFYELVLKVDSSVDVYNTDLIVFQTSGLLGEKSIAIIPKAPKPGSPPAHIVNNEILYAKSTDKVEEALNELIVVGDKVEQTMDRIINFIDTNNAEISASIKSFHRTSNEIGDFFDEANKNNLAQTLRTSVENFGKTMESTSSILEDVRSRDIIANFDLATGNFRDLIACIDPQTIANIACNAESALCSINAVFEDLAAGVGTLGRLLESDELYLRLNSAFSGVEGLLSDVKNYGLLFNYNKRWQRKQNREKCLTQGLYDAQGFSNYFNNQLYEINESYSDVSNTLNSYENLGQVCNNEDFMTQFYCLMKKVDELNSALKLYNQEIVEYKNLKNCANSCQ